MSCAALKGQEERQSCLSDVNYRLGHTYRHLAGYQCRFQAPSLCGLRWVSYGLGCIGSLKIDFILE